MRTIQKMLILILALIFSGCTSTKLLQTKADEKSQYIKTSAASIEYRILPQDRLKVVLYKDPQQSNLVDVQDQGLGQSIDKDGVLVNSAGYITMPLIGKVKVAGLTQTQAANRIAARYKKYIKTPSAYVEVLNKRIIVLGEVKSPGVVPVDKEKMTILEAIALAGGMKDTSVRDNIIVLYKTQGNKLAIRRIDLTNFDTMDYGSLMLRPNDIVYVQPNGWKEFKVNSDNMTSVFSTISTLSMPFATIKYLKN
jgi:polysaccharide export outer membrane protein